MARKLYRYEGPVMSFDKIIQDIWKGGTQAESEAKAKANLKFQYKVKHKLAKDSKIDLPGKLVIIE